LLDGFRENAVQPDNERAARWSFCRCAVREVRRRLAELDLLVKERENAVQHPAIEENGGRMVTLGDECECRQGARKTEPDDGSDRSMHLRKQRGVVERVGKLLCVTGARVPHGLLDRGECTGHVDGCEMLALSWQLVGLVQGHESREKIHVALRQEPGVLVGVEFGDTLGFNASFEGEKGARGR
jgi:hypothetical protein